MGMHCQEKGGRKGRRKKGEIGEEEEEGRRQTRLSGLKAGGAAEALFLPLV